MLSNKMMQTICKNEMPISKTTEADLETLEILNDMELLKEIELSQNAVDNNEVVLWEKIRIQV